MRTLCVFLCIRAGRTSGRFVCVCVGSRGVNRSVGEEKVWQVTRLWVGETMLWDSEYIESTEKWIAEEKVWFYNEIKDIEGIETFKTNTNFILVKLERLNSKILQERMLEKNILVRDASNFVGLNDKYIRLAIKDRENNIKVIQSLKEVLE